MNYYEEIVYDANGDIIGRIDGEAKKPIDLYYKLHKCLKIALNNDDLRCHVNNIIVNLAKSIESQEKWYDVLVDGWCDYFLKRNDQDISQ